MNLKESDFDTSEQNGLIKAWVPRCLIGEGKDVLGLPVTQEGLCPLQIRWESGKVVSIQGLRQTGYIPRWLLLPRFVEPHAHIDKAFTWNKNLNLKGTYKTALKNNLNEYKSRTLNDLYLRAEKSLELSFNNGIRSIRSHIDSIGIQAAAHWDLFKDLKKKWHSSIALQYVALVPIDFWSSREGELLARRVANSGGLLGGVIVPPFDYGKCLSNLLNLLRLAIKLDCEVDLHIDESQVSPAAGLKVLIKALSLIGQNISITCSHSSSMGLLPARNLVKLAKRLSRFKVNVVALPLTNSWLLGRHGRNTPVQRPLAPIYQLQKEGVVVAVGADNVNDPWFPMGNFDPLNLMAFSLPLAHLAPWDRLGLAPFTTAPAKILNQRWDGMIERGSPADWVLLHGTNWMEVLSSTPKREVIVEGRMIKKN